jgi:hypothetical protein
MTERSSYCSSVAKQQLERGVLAITGRGYNAAR